MFAQLHEKCTHFLFTTRGAQVAPPPPLNTEREDKYSIRQWLAVFTN